MTSSLPINSGTYSLNASNQVKNLFLIHPQNGAIHFLRKRDAVETIAETTNSTEKPVRTTSLIEHFLQNQDEFMDPATGKYYKPIGQAMTNPTELTLSTTTNLATEIRNKTVQWSTNTSPTMLTINYTITTRDADPTFLSLPASSTAYEVDFENASTTYAVFNGTDTTSDDFTSTETYWTDDSSSTEMTGESSTVSETLYDWTDLPDNDTSTDPGELGNFTSISETISEIYSRPTELSTESVTNMTRNDMTLSTTPTLAITSATTDVQNNTNTMFSEVFITTVSPGSAVPIPTCWKDVPKTEGKNSYNARVTRGLA